MRRRAYYFGLQKPLLGHKDPREQTVLEQNWKKKKKKREKAIMFNNRQAFILTSHFIHNAEMASGHFRVIACGAGQWKVFYNKRFSRHVIEKQKIQFQRKGVT